MTEQPPVDTTNPERPAPGTPEYALLMFDEGEDRDFVRTLSTEFEEISQEEVEQRVVALQQLAEQHFEAVRSEALKVNEAGSKMLSGTVSPTECHFGDPKHWAEHSVVQEMTYEQLRAFATENLDTAFWTSRSKTSQRPNEWSDIPEDESAAEPSALDKVHSLATMGEIIFSPFTGEYAVLVPRVNVDAARLERFSKLLQAVAISEYDRGQNGHPAFFDSYLEEFVSFEVRIVRIKTESQAEAPISAVVHNTLLGKARAWVEKQRNRFSK